MDHVGLLYYGLAVYKTNIFSTLNSTNGDVCLFKSSFNQFLADDQRKNEIHLMLHHQIRASEGLSGPALLSRDSAPGASVGGREGGCRPPLLLGSALLPLCTTVSSCFHTYFVSMLIPRAFEQRRPFPKLFRLDFYAISNFFKGHTCDTFSLTLKNRKRPSLPSHKEQSFGCVYNFLATALFCSPQT